MKGLGQPPQEGKPGCETDHVNLINGLAVDPDDVFGIEAVVGRHHVDVGAEVAAVANRDVNGGRLRDVNGRPAFLQGFEAFDQPGRVRDRRVIDDEQRAVGGDALAHAGGGAVCQDGGHGPDLGVGLRGDPIAVFHQQAAVPGDPVARMVVERVGHKINSNQGQPVNWGTSWRVDSYIG